MLHNADRVSPEGIAEPVNASVGNSGCDLREEERDWQLGEENRKKLTVDPVYLAEITGFLDGIEEFSYSGIIIADPGVLAEPLNMPSNRIEEAEECRFELAGPKSLAHQVGFQDLHFHVNADMAELGLNIDRC